MRSHASYAPSSGPTRARHLLVLTAAALALVILLAAAVAAISLVTSSPDNATDNSQATSTSTTGGPGGPSSPSGLNGQAVTNPRDWATDPDTGLPIGATVREGHPVEFPNTVAGAAAMVVELNRAQIGLDYDTALTTIRIYAAAENRAFFDALATSAVDQRREEVGVSTSFTAARVDGGAVDGADVGADVGADEVHAPVGYAQTPIGYQVEGYGPEQYLVSVLNEVTATTVNGRVNRMAYVGQQLVRWTRDNQDGAGDWQLVKPSDADRTQLAATPVPAVAELGSTAFQQAGWTALLQAGGPNVDSRTSSGVDNDAATGDPS